ncbi:MAG: YcjX family protein, partial [Pseudomonadota bacterium]
TFMEPVIRLGVTGLSRAGKTVFITSLVENLRDRSRMPQFKAAAGGRIEAAFLQPQPNQTIPRFKIEEHMNTLLSGDPVWPISTRSISQLRLSLRVRPDGLFGISRAPRTVHLDIIDYPGEWLLDLPLLEQSYTEWSTQAIDLAKGEARRAVAEPFLTALDKIDQDSAFSETHAEDLAGAFTEYLRACRDVGFSSCAPGRFLMPGDMEGSPAMTFCPLPGAVGGRGSLGREMQRRYEGYKSQVVLPFFRDHFAKLDRQVVLMDVLGALEAGPTALHDMSDALADILGSFKTGRNSILSRLFTRKIDRILFAATKADHIHHTQHSAVDTLLQSIVRKTKDAAEFKGVETRSMAMAAFRATVETNRTHQGQQIATVEGRFAEDGQIGASFPGQIPNDPRGILAAASLGGADWPDWEFDLQEFLPPKTEGQAIKGLPHIRMDQAVEFLLGDKL